jgi:hypothetical protein
LNCCPAMTMRWCRAWLWWPDEFLRAHVNSAFGSMDATCSVAGCR